MKKSPFKNLSFSDLVDGLYYVPAYQRDYGWDISLCDALLEDLMNEDITFIEGQVVLYENCVGGREINELVDGQQRVTTSVLLFAAAYTKILSDKEVLWGDLEDCEKNIVKAFNRPIRGSSNEKLHDILAEQGGLNTPQKFRMNISQREKWGDFCEFFDFHQENKKKVFNDERRKNPFIRNYEQFFKKFKNMGRTEFITALNNIGETSINIGIIQSDPVSRFLRLNQNKMDFKLEDFIKTIFFTTEGQGETDDEHEKLWLSAMDGIKYLQKNNINKSTQFTFENIFQWFLMNQGGDYMSHLKDLSKETKAALNQSRKSLDKLIEDVGDKFEVLKLFSEYIQTIIKSVTTDVYWNKNNTCKLTGSFSAIGTQHYTTYLLNNGVSEKEQKKIVDDILVPHFLRRMVYTDRTIASDMGLPVVMDFYEFMSKHTQLDIYKRYEAFFFFSNKGNKTPTLEELSKTDLVCEKYGNMAKVLQVYHGSPMTLEHIIPQNFLKNKKQFSDENFAYVNQNELNSKFNTYSELLNGVFHLGNMTLLPQKINSSLRDKNPYIKWNVLDQHAILIGDEYREAILSKNLDYAVIERRGAELLGKILDMSEIQCSLDKKGIIHSDRYISLCEDETLAIA